MVSEPSVVHHTSNRQVISKKLCLSAIFDRLIKTHISLRLGDGSSLGALWELVAVAGIKRMKRLLEEITSRETSSDGCNKLP